MRNNRITVVVPAYNNETWLPRCLDSLLAQDHPDMEIIVVNDGSSDGTAKVLDGYAERYANIVAVHQENAGVTAARLAGVRQATGDWIGFVDSDDTVDPDMYSHLLANAKKEGADIAHCGHQTLFPDGRIVYVHNTGDYRRQDRLTGMRELLDGGQIEGSLCTKLYRTELFEGLTEWIDTSIKNGEDYLMNYYLFSRASGAVYEDFCPYHYILRHGSASFRQFNEHSLFDPIRARQHILSRCEPEMEPDVRQALMRNMLFAYGQMALNLNKQYDGYRARARALILEQRNYFHLLSTRNKVLANMICIAPWTFHVAYGLYVKLFQKEEQH
ncbi:MAG: glycosyltransferase family 2 protein [Oscillospiraceae bacterium]|nr:glycosyltransferase family 2 protein [Oscillospiraceae bacterium]